MPVKYLAIVVGSAIVALGALGVVRPDLLVLLMRPTVTPIGLYVTAAIRLCIGAILLLAASTSRAPAILRAFGIMALAAGVATVLIGVDRAQDILAGWSGQGPGIVRLTGLGALAVGGLVVFLSNGVRSAS